MITDKLQKLDNLKQELDALRPLKKEQLDSIKTMYDVELTYNSNAIEGSTLDYAETKIILLEGLTIGGKTTREHLEAINHKTFRVYCYCFCTVFYCTCVVFF